MEQRTGFRHLRRMNDALQRGLTIAGIIFFTVFIAVVFLQVISRNYLRISMLWIQEVALFCFIWSVFLGGAIAVRERKHYIVEIFPARMTRLNLLLDLFADAALFAMVYVLLPIGLQFTELGINRLSRVLMVPQAFFFAAFPVAGVCYLLFGIENLLDDIRRLRSFRPESS